MAISPIVCLENLIELFSDVFLDGLPIVDVGAAGFEDDEVIVQVDLLIPVLALEVLRPASDKFGPNAVIPLAVD